RREEDLVLLAEREDLVSQAREIRGDDEGEVFAVCAVQRLRPFDYEADELEVQEWFPALELDLQVPGRTPKREREGAFGVVATHVERGLVLSLARDLAVVTRVIAPE